MFGVQKFLIPSQCYESAYKILALCKKYEDEDFYTTVGLGPCRCLNPLRSKIGMNCSDGTEKTTTVEREMLYDTYFKSLEQIIETAPPGKVVAIGNCGFDFRRLDFADKQC